MNRQIQARMDGERRAQLSLIRLLCAVSVWRTIMTRMLPLCGVSAWWTALLCLLPGAAAALLLRGMMALTRTATITEALRACLGRAGVLLLSLILAVLLLTDGIASITALITLFTEGLGTRGTQFTLAVLTGVMLLFSLHREGLARAVVFLRWGMIAAAVLAAACLLSDAKPDNLFPLSGEETAATLAALKAGMSLGWPLALLLTVPPSAGTGRLRGGVLPVFGAVAAVFLLALIVPHELLMRQSGLASLLLLPTRYSPNALRVVAMSLLMLVFFLSIGASAQLATKHLGAPWKSLPAWLPYVLLAGMFLTQAADVSRLWQGIGCIEPWLLFPLALLALVCLPIALIRRKMR
ncbi:MAG: hypothetical protein ACI4WX_01140 [Aristaeellaceae bacterium]